MMCLHLAVEVKGYLKSTEGSKKGILKNVVSAKLAYSFGIMSKKVLIVLVGVKDQQRSKIHLNNLLLEKS